MLIEETVADRKRVAEELEAHRDQLAAVEEERDLLQERLQDLEDREEMAGAGIEGSSLVDSGKLAAEARPRRDAQSYFLGACLRGRITSLLLFCPVSTVAMCRICAEKRMRGNKGGPRRKNRSTGGQTYHMVIVAPRHRTRRNRGPLLR